LDSLLLWGPPADLMRDYAGLALARLYAALGSQRRALAAARRRPHMQQWPHFLAAQALEEGRLSASAGDTSGAVAAYRLFLALRSSSRGESRAEVNAIRAELETLVTGPKSDER
jgi:hypothetical protein